MSAIDEMWSRKIDVDGFSCERVLDALQAWPAEDRPKLTMSVHPLIFERMQSNSLIDAMPGKAVPTFLGYEVVCSEKLRQRCGFEFKESDAPVV